ncbi:hypothetical protein [Actinomadura napierensis]|uniref:Uncharacterized protein n=1 Tax=Actinomadura napierensis TaxID=267854 RepID=A0ABN2YKE4_9ACTN
MAAPQSAPRRRWRREGPDPETAAGTAAPGVPPPAVVPPGVQGRAMLDGARAAAAREYDEWSFAPGTRLPYLERLRHEREQAVALNAASAFAAARAILAQVRHQRRDERHAAATAQAGLDQALRWRDRAYEREDITLAGLDVLAGQHMPPDRPGWDDADVPDDDPDDPTATAEAGDTGDTGDTVRNADPHGPPNLGSADPGPGGERPAPASGDREKADAAPVTRGGRRRLGWMGPADGSPFAMPMPERYKRYILVALIAVEVPIYHDIFLHLHGADDWLTWAYTLPVALGMVAAPHLAGRLFRHRHLMPVERIAPVLVAATMVLWAAGALALGWLRQQVLLVPRRDPVTGQDIGGVHQLGLQHGHIAMTAVFAIILLLSGLIAFTLGMAEEHPAVAAYRAAVRVSERAQALFLEATSEESRTRDSTLVPEEEQLRAHWHEAQEHRTAIAQEHLAAEKVYLDAVALGIGRPTTTQAVSAYLDEPPAGGDGGAP